MQSYPGFAGRAEAAFGAALGRGVGAWRVATTVAPFSAGGEGSDSGDEDEEGAPAFCKAFEAEPEEAEEDILARAASSPPHLVELGDTEEQRETSPAGRVTVYVLDEPLYVGSGARGDRREAAQPPQEAHVLTAAQLLRRSIKDMPAGARPPPEPPKFQGVLRLSRQKRAPDAKASAAACSTGGKAAAAELADQAASCGIGPEHGRRRRRWGRRRGCCGRALGRGCRPTQEAVSSPHDTARRRRRVKCSERR